jgi:hypothetical protein
MLAGECRLGAKTDRTSGELDTASLRAEFHLSLDHFGGTMSLIVESMLKLEIAKVLQRSPYFDRSNTSVEIPISPV